jgi:hypothetical protein
VAARMAGSLEHAAAKPGSLGHGLLMWLGRARPFPGNCFSPGSRRRSRKQLPKMIPFPPLWRSSNQRRMLSCAGVTGWSATAAPPSPVTGSQLGELATMGCCLGIYRMVDWSQSSWQISASIRFLERVPIDLKPLFLALRYFHSWCTVCKVHPRGIGWGLSVYIPRRLSDLHRRPFLKTSKLGLEEDCWYLRQQAKWLRPFTHSFCPTVGDWNQTGASAPRSRVDILPWWLLDRFQKEGAFWGYEGPSSRLYSRR